MDANSQFAVIGRLPRCSDLVAFGAVLVGDSALQERFPVLGLAFPHELFADVVAAETVPPLECPVHSYHRGVFAVTDVALEG